MSGPAATIIPSCRWRCRSRRRPARGCWCAPAPDAATIREALGAGAGRTVRGCREASSVHVTFLPRRNGRSARRHGFLQRTDQQFHWENAGYAHLRRLPRRARLAQAQDHPPRAARGARDRHQRPLADRRRPHRGRSGTPSSPSTWTPARANGAGPISRARSSR